jgi:hypothetical protein
MADGLDRIRPAARGRYAALAAAALALLAVILPAAAPARTIAPYHYSQEFVDGTGSDAGTFRDISDVAINQQGRLLVLDRFRLGGSVMQFELDGDPLDFSALGTNSITGISDSAQSVGVDNSGTSSQGNIVVETGEGDLVRGFSAAGSEFGLPFPLAGFQQSCAAAVDPEGDIWVSDSNQSRIVEFTSLGVATGERIETPRPCHFAIDSQGNFYVVQQNRGEDTDERTRKYSSDGTFLYELNGVESMGVAIDPSDDSVFLAEFGPQTRITHYDSTGTPLSTFGEPDPGNNFLGLEGGNIRMAVDPNTHDVYVAHSRDYSPGGGGGQNAVLHVDIFEQSGEFVVPTVTTDPPNLTPSSATLRGTVDLTDGGGDTATCFFEWGTTQEYGNTLPCDPAAPHAENQIHQVTAQLEGLSQGTNYHYRLVATNGNELVAAGKNQRFRPQGPALISGQTVTNVLSDGVRFAADVDPNGGDLTYHFEYGPGDCELVACQSTPDQELDQPLGEQVAERVLSGLSPDTTYHFRIVAENAFGVAEGPDYVFTTYPKTVAIDPCANAPVRKQTGAGLLLDCRAYELASAANAGGYDVTSDLLSGEQPLRARPRVADQVLYSVNFGTIPGAGDPTNLGRDPYVARRGPNGWTTSYAGIPATGIPSDAPFGSPVAGSDQSFSTVAYGGPSLCDPCFGDGSVGIPVRLSSGQLVQGMQGSMAPGPAAQQDGFIGEQLSGDGSHLLFGSTSRFEPDGNQNGDVSIYSRNLETGVTRVVSKAPGGANLTCLAGAGSCHAPGNPHGIGALDISFDGSRVLVAQRISADAQGNEHWHPYMTIEGSPSTTVDLAPGTTSGVLYAGMNDDGTRAYFVSRDQLTPDDDDTSADLFRADVGTATATLTKVSSGGGAGNVDSCDPDPASSREDWNTVSGPTDCSVVAIAGGGGVSGGNGTVFFLSPEQLDGAEGEDDAANLYAAVPGQAPQHVAVLEPGNSMIENGLFSIETRSSEDLQVTPDGAFAVLASSSPLTDFPQFGHRALFRYARGADQLSCVSCPATGAGLATDTSLSQYGLNLSDDGRVFYTTAEQLVLRDTAGKRDVYEWDDGVIELISTGISPGDSGLVTASANGVDVFFFTRESLSPDDRNGGTLKIYDAREDGGFYSPPSPVPCQASDECHGPGTVAAPPPAIGSFRGTGGNAKHAKRVRCKRGKVRKRNRCVKRNKRKRRSATRRRR